MERPFVKTTYLIRIEITAERKIRKDTLVRYLINGLEHSKSGRLGYNVTVYDDFEILQDATSSDTPPDVASDP